MSVLDYPITDIHEANRIAGGGVKPNGRHYNDALTSTGKMPCPSYALPASECNIGGKLHLIEGSVCYDCYAMKHRYVWKNNQLKMFRCLEAIRHDRWVDAMVFLIGTWCEKNGVPFFRWHDSGEIQDLEHLEKICEVAQRLPEVHFWLPTRERPTVRQYILKWGDPPVNLNIRKSMPMMDMAPPKKGIEDGMIYSMVNRELPAPADAHSCPAPQQGGECGSCRACWDTDVQLVSYSFH